MRQQIRIIADAHIWGAEQAFSTLPGYDVSLTLCHNSDMCAENLRDADIILVRSAIKIDRELLQQSRVRFVATATVGDDHIDKKWLQERGIAFASAAGSSTGAVVEYMTTLLLHLHHIGKLHLPNCTLGIIGAGRIGSRIAAVAHTLGMEVIINDPPRSRLEGEEAFANLETLLKKSDIITLHTPLIRGGIDSTVHLIDTETLATFTGFGIINAARGAVVANKALIDWLDQSPLHFAACDCWENEPNISMPLLAHAGMTLATPHIAGHSLDGKAANTQYVYDALCRFLNIEPVWNMNTALPDDVALSFHGDSQSTLSTVHAISEMLYPIRRDHQTFTKLLHIATTQEQATTFTTQRRHYPVRRAWDRCTIHMQHTTQETLHLAHHLGIRLMT